MRYKLQFQRQKYTDAVVHACGSERPKRNQRNFHQLQRALEQCKRVDRLSVGRIHNQHVHNLRTGLSVFERRKRDQLPRDRLKCEHHLLLPTTNLQRVCYKPQFECRVRKNEDRLTFITDRGGSRGQCPKTSVSRDIISFLRNAGSYVNWRLGQGRSTMKLRLVTPHSIFVNSASYFDTAVPLPSAIATPDQNRLESRLFCTREREA